MRSDLEVKEMSLVKACLASENSQPSDLVNAVEPLVDGVRFLSRCLYICTCLNL
jgi:hypothetical protein